MNILINKNFIFFIEILLFINIKINKLIYMNKINI